MRSFEHHIFINRPKDIVFDHIANPLNMLGLQPLLTTMDILEETRDSNGVKLRPFYTVEVFRWAGIPLMKNRIHSVIHLTEPDDEPEFHASSKPGIEIVFQYRFQQDNDGHTHVTQTICIERAPKLLEGFVFDQAIKAQRALLSNLKVRLEK